METSRSDGAGRLATHGTVTREHHPHGEYDFLTNSRVEPDAQFSRYFACVENNNKEAWLRLSWYIPLIGDRWVPPGDYIEQSRLSTDPDARPVLGCVQYGNLGDKVVAQLLGDARDERKSANDASEIECRKSIGFDSQPSADAVELPANGVSEKTLLFVPSDLSDPINSMLEIDVSYGIKTGCEGYASFFMYRAEPYKGSSKADPSQIRIRPRFTPDAKSLYNTFNEQVASDCVKLDNKGGFGFSVVGTNKNNWTIQPAFYDFVDKDGNILSSLSVPLFAPAAR